MEKSSELWEGVNASEEVIGNGSWFKDTPHYWAEASLPFAYAVACVEVVSEKSEKARILYDRIIEAWSDAGIKAVFDEIASIIPESESGKIKNALLHPEIPMSFPRETALVLGIACHASSHPESCGFSHSV